MENNKSILMCSSDVKLAGPAKLMLETAKLLSDDFKISVCTGGGEFVKEFNNNNIKHYCLDDLRIENRGGFLTTLNLTISMAKLIKSEKADIVHCYNAHTAIICMIASWMSFRKVKVVNTVLGNGKEKILKYIPLKYIAVSKSVSDKMQKYGVKKSNINIVYNSIIPECQVISSGELNKKISLRTEKIRIVSIAMFTGKKGHERIIKLMSNLPSRIDYEITFIGDGPTKEACEILVNDLGLSGKIKFVGKQNNVFEWLDNADLFLHLPDMETFGMVLIEAMARGVPVVATNVGGIPEVVGEGGELIEVNANSDELEKSISVIMNEDKYIEYANSAVDRVKNKFTLRKLKSDLINVYFK